MSAEFLIYLKLFTTVLLLTSIERSCNAQEAKGPIVTIPQGTLQGRFATTSSGYEFQSFQGIPYAQPPIGKLRFRDPKPPSSWTGILNATAPGNSCPQYDVLFLKKLYGTENCLFINVYVPNNKPCCKNLPVMVWIHGGGFIMGDGNSDVYGPDFLIEYDIILVTFNYRLGAMGFLSMDTPDAPGNAGLKDQSAALKWVKDNIAYFGGDTHKITIFGESAGAASVQYHTVTPLSKGLFNGAIMQSGSCTCPWALQPNPVKIAFALSEALGYKSSNKTSVLRFLRNVPEQDLVMGSLTPYFTGRIVLAFAPVVETIFPNVKPFITKAPIEILTSEKFNRVPTLSGVTSLEGLIYMIPGFANAADEEAIVNNQIPNVKKFVPMNLVAKYGVNVTDNTEAKIRQYYFPSTDNILEGFVSLLSDFAFVKNMIISLKLHAKHAPPTYFYKFSYSGSKNMLRFISDLQYEGSAHTDELAYLFRAGIMDGTPPLKADTILTKRLTAMWTNFAKFGNPTPKSRNSSLLPVTWVPVKSNNIKILNIDKKITLISNPFEEAMKFWNDILNM